jgi:pyruvyltransferase
LLLKIWKAKRNGPAIRDLELTYPHASLYHWRPRDGGINFGDHLSKIIVGQLLASRGLTFDDETRKHSRILAIGSILHFARDGDIVWGSGINGKLPEAAFTAKRLDIRAVRGPLTAEFLRKRGFNVPDVFGDPGILVRALFADRFLASATRDFVFVPNLHDLHLVGGMKNVISPLEGWNTVVANVTGAKLVLSSSLHGIVVAESFGIPARYVRLSETESLFKYKDYVYGTGRDEFEYATSLPQGLEMGGMPFPSFDRESLINSFPWDAWNPT